MKKWLSFVLKCCNLLALTSLITVGALFALSLFQAPYTVKVIPVLYGASFGCYLLAGFLSFLFSRIRTGMEKSKGKAIWFNLAFYAFPVFAAIALSFIFVLPRAGFWLALSSAAFFTAAYLTGAKVAVNPYSYMDTYRGIVRGSICVGVFYLLSFLLHWGYDFLEFPYLWYLWLYLPFVVCYLFLGNQINLDDLMTRRKVQEGMPKKIRRYNLIMTSLVIAALFLLICFRGLIVDLIMLIGRWGRTVVTIILQLMVGDPGEVGEYTYMQDMAESAKQGMGRLPTSQSWWGWDVIFYLVIPAVAIFILFWYRDQILYVLKEAGRKIWHGFLSLLLRLGRSGKVITENNVEYMDEYQELAPEEKDEKERPGTFRSKRKFLRYLKRIDDPAAYVRECYRYMMEYFKGLGRKLTPADTAREIGGKISSEWNKERVMNVTGIYEEVRYNGIVPDEEMCRRLREDCLSLTDSK